MQRFFRGNTFWVVMGTAQTIFPSSGKKDAPFSIIKLQDEPTKCPHSIRHHICWVMPEAFGSAETLLDFRFQPRQISSDAGPHKALKAVTSASASVVDDRSTCGINSSVTFNDVKVTIQSNNSSIEPTNGNAVTTTAMVNGNLAPPPNMI